MYAYGCLHVLVPICECVCVNVFVCVHMCACVSVSVSMFVCVLHVYKCNHFKLQGAEGSMS